MHATTTPGFSHASVERLCDYELPDPPARTALAASPPSPVANDPGKLALNWWLWMDEMNKSMWHHYDAWREHFTPSTKGPTRRG
ncbi:hypothetical protein J2W30_005403 [Variovorax boronicumulans]|uniref:hypothetical protein n=1 Tax=Variovorax TaxID=34072 RepID=UPI002789E68E|nr:MULTISPECIES: hypothetical protein [Variovorax]MDQ0037626.1 hypothetical protein [Variovorax boronicumulans]MDQ0605993.1 hypothetical protein [Variovorax sp. W1I1]